MRPADASTWDPRLLQRSATPARRERRKRPRSAATTRLPRSRRADTTTPKGSSSTSIAPLSSAPGLRTSIVTHELRHTAAAVWLSLGFPVEYVRRQMGHRDIATTIRNYGHLERTLIPDAAARTEAAVLVRPGILVAIW